MKKSREKSSPGEILPQDPLTTWMDEPETRRALTLSLIKDLRAEMGQPSTRSRSNTRKAPELAPTEEVDLKPVAPSTNSKPQAWTREEMLEAGIPENLHSQATWWNSLEEMKEDLNL